ncbi:MAG: CCA tRNA nucleotidyltransferase [Hyphomicrobiales bacterium]|nr:CCA tRNA nucleotidyltransferase [Hyphomicrobiales bacterium]
MNTAAQTQRPLSVADAEWFQWPELHRVFDALNTEGHEARVVGGALRNTLMNLPISDIDFAVTAEPEEMIRLAEAASLKTVLTGLSHGTITIVVDGIPFEATSLRHDVETDGRYAKVAFTRDWAADASRRDFTINALYADAGGQVYDPLGEGVSDIGAGQIRFIGQAIERIREDYLRILRFFRFTAEYGRSSIDSDGLAACIEGRDGLKQLSAERVRTELLRILAADRPMLALNAMADSKILEMILDTEGYLQIFARLAEIETKLNLHAYPVRRLAALSVAGPDDAGRIAKKLKLSNAEASSLKSMAIHTSDMCANLPLRGQREALYRLGHDLYSDCVLIGWSRSNDALNDEHWRLMMELPRRWTAPEFEISGKDLLARGFEPGPELGKALGELEERWIASDFKLSRDKLLASIGKS